MNSNIATRFEDAAKANPKKVVLVGPKNSFTWEELDLRAGGVALVLGEAGIGPGERVAVLFDDPVNTIVGVIGCLKKGCTVTPLHPRSTARERARILEVLKPAYFLENLTDAVEMYQPAVVNFNDPAIIRMVVVFPAPLGPRKPTTSPFSIWKFRLLIACRGP